jgi:hypothetical protein
VVYICENETEVDDGMSRNNSETSLWFTTHRNDMESYMLTMKKFIWFYKKNRGGGGRGIGEKATLKCYAKMQDHVTATEDLLKFRSYNTQSSVVAY